MDLKGFFVEVRRRRVGRVAALYAGGAFAVLEGADIVLEVLGLPEGALALLVVLSLLGFPAALFVGWTFDLTRWGLVRVGPSAPDPGASAGGETAGPVVGESPSAAPRPRYVLFATVWSIGLLVLATAVLVAAAGPVLRRPDPGPDVRSVAVLPLANQTGDPDQQYFVDGMHDALIRELARIDGLTVISRTSVVRYRTTVKSVAEISAELGVDALVEGSIFRSGDSVRVHVRLLRGDPEEQIWGRSYDGRWSEAFDLQRRIAGAITSEVRIRLSRAERRRLVSTTDLHPAAQEAYLQGRAHWRSRSREGLARAVDLLQEAVRIQPDFALAHAGLADAYVVARGYGAIDLPWREAYARARAHAERALELDPRVAEAHAALGFLRLQAERDVEGAEEALRTAVSLNPSLAQAHAWLSTVLQARGEAAEAAEAAHRARMLDPFAPLMNRYLAFALAKADRCEDAIPYARFSLELDPLQADGHWLLWSCHLLAGRYEEAVAEAAAAYREWGVDEEVLEGYRRVFAEGGWSAALEREVEILQDPRIPVRTEYMVAQRYALLALPDAAFLALRAAEAAGDPLLLFTARLDPILAPLRSDPRFRALRVGSS